MTNEFGQAIGDPVPGWHVPPRPQRELRAGRLCRLVPLDPARHALALYEAFSAFGDERMWTYLPYGPFASFAAFDDWIHARCLGDDPLFFAVETPEGQPLGLVAYLRIDPQAGSIEVGHLLYSPEMKRSPVATEAMQLMMQTAFALGYRRYEWKCDTLNVASRAAAERLGFSCEGIFRQATVIKGRNRDTVWYALLDRDWPAVGKVLAQWLDPANFDAAGRQRTRLSELTAPLRLPRPA